MLRFAEEIMLLLLHDSGGRFARVPEQSVRYALVGGVLMDLALENRIDTDLRKLEVVDATPTGDALLDPSLTEIAHAERTRDAGHWVERLLPRAADIRAGALSRLTERGILERRDDRFLWVFRSRRYPVVDGEAEREVKLRIFDVLFGQNLPDPRDVALICLADACGIFGALLSEQELAAVRPRFEQSAQDGPHRSSCRQGDRRRGSGRGLAAQVSARATGPPPPVVRQPIRRKLQAASSWWLMPRSLAFEPAPASVGHSLAKNARLVRLDPPGSRRPRQRPQGHGDQAGHLAGANVPRPSGNRS